MQTTGRAPDEDDPPAVMARQQRELGLLAAEVIALQNRLHDLTSTLHRERSARLEDLAGLAVLRHDLAEAAAGHVAADGARVALARVLRDERAASTPKRPPSDLDRIRRSSFFDAEWYRARHPDVAAAGTDPAVHYLRHGATEGRPAGPHFDTGWYLTTYPDVAAAGVNPLVHFLTSGCLEGRLPSPPGSPSGASFDGS